MVLLPILKAIAQPSEVCYTITPSGRLMDLSALCCTSTPTAPAPRPDVFRATIKQQGRSTPTPVIDVVFNNSQTFEMSPAAKLSGIFISQDMARVLGVVPVTTTRVMLGKGRAVELPAGYVNSVSVGGQEIHNVQVGIAPEEGDTGLLGLDLFGNYNAKIERDSVEFSRR